VAIKPVVNNIFAWPRMNFAIVVYCLRRACRFSTCIDSFSHFWTDRGQHGEESEEGEEGSEKSSQEENREEEEVVSTQRTNRCFPLGDVLTRSDGLRLATGQLAVGILQQRTVKPDLHADICMTVRFFVDEG
jgi:hypothetical protein